MNSIVFIMFLLCANYRFTARWRRSFELNISDFASFEQIKLVSQSKPTFLDDTQRKQIHFLESFSIRNMLYEGRKIQNNTILSWLLSVSIH